MKQTAKIFAEVNLKATTPITWSDEHSSSIPVQKSTILELKQVKKFLNFNQVYIMSSNRITMNPWLI
jgi:hypothetical protein